MRRPVSRVVAAILVLGVALVAVTCSGSPGAIEQNNRGAALLREGSWEAAIAELDKAIELDPTLAAAYNNRGRAYSELGQHERAIAEYGKAIELNPDAVAYYNRGSLYSDLGQWEQAIADYDKAIELKPDFAAYMNRGFAYLGLKQWDQAIADYDKAIELDSAKALAYANRGVAYHSLGQKEQARADYQKAVSLSDDPALTAKIQASLDRLATAWPSEWERGVCGAYAALFEEVDARKTGLDKACPKGGECAAAALGFETAAGHADKAIALLKAVPSWSPGQPWVDNLMTQAVGYRDTDRVMAGSLRAADVGDTAGLLVAYALVTRALKQPTYLAAQKASRGLTQVITSVHDATGFLCPK